MTTKIFDIKRDIEIVDAGGFSCYACLIGKPAIEQSPDPRYCQNCYELLMKEMAMLNPRDKPKWVPKNQKLQAKIKPEKVKHISPYPRIILSTVNEQKITVDKKKPTTPKRGRPQILLPEAKIKEMHLGGMGAKAIANHLKVKGLNISYRTIYRYLQRVG